LDAPTPSGAVDALTTQTRNALRCIAPVEVLGTGAAPGLTNNLRFISPGSRALNLLPLRRVDGTLYLQLKAALEYSVVGVADAGRRPRFEPVVTMYLYSVLDLAGRELFAYHWHPDGVSAVRTPHFHASSIPPITLPERSGGPETMRLDISHAHFPTQQIEITEIVRLLIRDPGVGPRRPDWERVLGHE